MYHHENETHFGQVIYYLKCVICHSNCTKNVYIAVINALPLKPGVKFNVSHLYAVSLALGNKRVIPVQNIISVVSLLESADTDDCFVNKFPNAVERE